MLVLLAAASVALTRPAPGRPAEVRPTASAVLVSRSQLGCPDPPSVGGADTSVKVGLAAALTAVTGRPAEAGPTAGGVVEAGSKLDLARGRLATVPAAGGPPVRATGAAAAGLFAFRTDRTDRGTLAVASCLAPRARWWFTGAGAGLDHTSTLVVDNLDPGPAVVDLRVLGPDGEVDTVATTGIVIAARSQRRIPLEGVAPQTDEMALEVHAQRGRVVASVTDTIRDQPASDPGRDWVPGTEEPSRTLWLAGLPGGPFRRTLLVANPSDLEAVLTVSVSGRSGTYTPAGADEITVVPGGVRAVDLGRAAPDAEAVAVRLSSSTPVLASVRSTRDGDHAYAGAATALTGPAAAPLVPGARASVQLTAGSAATRVQMVAYDGQGHRLEGRTLTVAATATAVWSPAATTGYVVITPTDPPGMDPGMDPGGDPGIGIDRGGVRGAVTYVGGGLAAVPLMALPLRELRPHVEPGLR